MSESTTANHTAPAPADEHVAAAPQLQASIDNARYYQQRLEARAGDLRAQIAQASRPGSNGQGSEQQIAVGRTSEFQSQLEAAIRGARAHRAARSPDPSQPAVEKTPDSYLQLSNDPSAPSVDIMVVAYNARRWLDGFLGSLQTLQYPAARLRLLVIDNGSSDDSVATFRSAAAELPYPVEIVETGRNVGFTGGYAEAFRRGSADYYFVVNLDTIVSPDAIAKLIDVLLKDPRAGIAEARQAPLEHPKYYDPITRETSWCSGACMMIRSAALLQVGGFEEMFFMYAEDVDLSWRMWLAGWKCLYVPEAVVQHFTEQLDPQRDQTCQHYYSMRNGAWMRVMYAGVSDILLYYAAMLRVAIFARNPFWHRRLTLKALFASLLRLPAAWRGRRNRANAGSHPWVRFNGWLYGRHARDIAIQSGRIFRPVLDLVAALPGAEKTLSNGLSANDHIIVPQSAVSVAWARCSAVLVYDSARVTYQVAAPPNSVVQGAVAAPQDTWPGKGAGRFEILQDGEPIWHQDLKLASPDHRQWLRFEVPLSARRSGAGTKLTLAFQGVRNLKWGLWGDVRVAAPVDSARAASSPPPPGMAVSIIVPTHNRAHGLERLVARLMAQDIPATSFEVILIDSNSKDQTPSVMQQLAARYPNLTALRCERPGAAAARNMGLDRARGSLIVLVDDDILVCPDFLRRLLAASRRYPQSVLLARIAAPWQDSTDPFIRFLLKVEDVNIYDFQDSENVPANYFYTGCVAIPRGVLGNTRFDEGFLVYGVEDIEFGFRLLSGNRRMVYLPEVEVCHEYFPVYGPYLRKKHRAGYSLGYFLKTHPQYAGQFVFERRFTQYGPALRAMLWLSAPFARLSRVLETIRYAPGPISPFLFQWMLHDLRLTMYSGLTAFCKGSPPP